MGVAGPTRVPEERLTGWGLLARPEYQKNGLREGGGGCWPNQKNDLLWGCGEGVAGRGCGEGVAGPTRVPEERLSEDGCWPDQKNESLGFAGPTRVAEEEFAKEVDRVPGPMNKGKLGIS